MLIVPPSRVIKKQPKIKPPPTVAPVPPVVQPLVLQSAQFDASNVLKLVFDRAINIDQILLTEFYVNDGVYNHRVMTDGYGPLLVDPQTVQFYLTAQGTWDVADIELSASDSTGIVAVDDGGTWPGVDGMVIG